MYRVLLPLDGEMDRARRQARYVTSQPCAAEEFVAVVGHALTSEERDVPDAMRRIDRVETVRRVTEIFDEADVEYETRELSTPPESGIADIVDNEEIDEIVMGGKGRSPAEKAVLGSVTQTVILNSDIPVVVTGGD